MVAFYVPKSADTVAMLTSASTSRSRPKQWPLLTICRRRARHSSWEENILGNDSLDDGDTQPVDINDGSGKCVFDFKAVFKNGSTAEKLGVNVCQISTFTFTR